MKSQICMTHKIHTTRSFSTSPGSSGSLSSWVDILPYSSNTHNSFFQILKRAEHIPASGPLHELFPLLPDTWLTPPHPQGIRVSVSSAGRPSLNQIKFPWLNTFIGPSTLSSWQSPTVVSKQLFLELLVWSLFSLLDNNVSG